MRNTLAALVAGVVLIASCDGNGPGDQPAEETDGVPTAAANQQSDAGCPAPITVGSGLGQQQVGTVALVASGIGSGAAIAQLLKEFNRRAADEGFRYCIAGGCLCRYVPATAANIRYERRDFSGWVETTILPTG